MPFSVRVEREHELYQVRLMVAYRREPDGDTLYVSHSISEETLHSPDAFYACGAAVTRIIHRLRAELSIKDYYAVEHALMKLVQVDLGIYPPYVPKSNHSSGLAIDIPIKRKDPYREKAAVEFDGVVDLDDSLWEKFDGSGLL